MDSTHACGSQKLSGGRRIRDETSNRHKTLPRASCLVRGGAFVVVFVFPKETFMQSAVAGRRWSEMAVCASMLRGGARSLVQRPRAVCGARSFSRSGALGAAPASAAVAAVVESEGGDTTEIAREIRAGRLGKAAAMRAKGVQPFAYTFAATHTCAELQAQWVDLADGFTPSSPHSVLFQKREGEAGIHVSRASFSRRLRARVESRAFAARKRVGAEDAEARVAVRGRIMAKRVFGKKLAFFSLRDVAPGFRTRISRHTEDFFRPQSTFRERERKRERKRRCARAGERRRAALPGEETRGRRDGGRGARAQVF